MRTRFDLLTSFRQGDMSVDEWYNAVQTQIALAKYPQETAQILQRDIFWFFLKDESFVSKTLNEGYVELSKFPASTVHQLDKRWKVPNLQKSISNKLQGTHKEYKLISCDISSQRYHPVSLRRKIKPSSLGKKLPSIMKMQESTRKEKI